jgi:hypothetical protein
MLRVPVPPMILAGTSRARSTVLPVAVAQGGADLGVLRVLVKVQGAGRAERRHGDGPGTA